MTVFPSAEEVFAAGDDHPEQKRAIANLLDQKSEPGMISDVLVENGIPAISLISGSLFRDLQADE